VLGSGVYQKEGGSSDGGGGFGVERDVLNACFILCFLEGKRGIMHVSLLNTFYFLISDIPFRYP